MIKVHLNPDAIPCGTCKKYFYSLNAYGKHLVKMHNDVTLIEQLKTEHGILIDVFVCCQCEKCFTSKEKLSQHEKDHGNPLTSSKRKHLCAHCPKTFPSPASRALHERSHTGEKPFKCTLCELSFAAKGNLTSHTKSHDNKKEFACSTCCKRFNTKRDLKTHEKHTHSDVKAYVCQGCGESYKRPMNLRRHRRTCNKTITIP